MRTLLFAVFASVAVPAFAQSSLGVTGAAFSLGMVEDEGGEFRGEASAVVDVAITAYHGFQGDLRFSDTETGGIGTTAAHLYMTPREGQKYGLFAALSDVDGRGMLYGSLGAEGIFSLGDRTSVEVRGGMGWADSDGLDYIFGGAALAHALTSSLELELSLDLADFDEVGLSATAYDLGASLRYQPEGRPWGGYVSVTQSGLAGTGSGEDATRIGIGLTLNLGASGGTNPHTRPFRTPDPVAPLIRRGLW